MYFREKIRKKKMQEKVKLEHIRNLHAVSAFLKVGGNFNEFLGIMLIHDSLFRLQGRFGITDKVATIIYAQHDKILLKYIAQGCLFDFSKKQQR